jgi:spermidine/putrescine transport system permease protein
VIERQFLQARNWPFGSALAMVIMASVLIVLLLVVLRASRARSIARAAGSGHA